MAQERDEAASPPALNLLIDFAEAAERLSGHLHALDGAEAVFDAFLLAAGLHQIAEDHLHRDAASLGRVARHLPQLAGERAGRAGAPSLELLLTAALAVRARRPAENAALAWEQGIAEVTGELARCVAARTAPQAALLDRATRLLAAAGALPRSLRASVIRLPHCFRSFDQRPEDVRALVAALDRAPRLVVGVRTAGSYLGPLVSAELERRGSGPVGTLTLRPGQRWLAHELRALREAAGSGATVAVVDEPPRTGRLLVQAARQIERAGVPRASIVLLAPLFGRTPPPAFAGYEVIALPWAEWAVHERLRPAAVREALSQLLAGLRVTDVQPLRTPEPRRGHLQAAFRVSVVDERTGGRSARDVCVEGAGLGYLGRHALAVARPLAGLLPAVYGLRDGLLYREWLPDDARLRRPGPAAASRIADYVHARSRALAVPDDPSRRLVGREAAWELAADLLGDAFGRARLPLRPLTHAAARRLLRTPRPSIVDGSMSPPHWFAAADGGLRKVDFHTRAFSNRDAASYDPVFDLAGAAWDGLDDALRREFERRSGRDVGDERWLLLRLVHHWIERRAAYAEADAARVLAAERAMTRIYREYIAGELLAGVRSPGDGPLCAIDIDWVLEVRWAGFPALSPAAALALRALSGHGQRAVLVTGRSLTDVRERCEAYGLAGGVAEYGGAVYDHVAGAAQNLLSDAEREDLDALRAVLREMPGVHLDPDYEHSVRAYRLATGSRLGLDGAAVDRAIAAAAPGRLRAVAARSQTDFATARLDKGAGLRALAERLGGAGVGLGVGDGDADLPMLALAAWPAAPANADDGVRSSAAARAGRIHFMGQPYGAGLLAAVAAYLGHSPRRCRTCAPPRVPGPEAALLLSVLGALDGGAHEKLRHATLLTTRLDPLDAGIRRLMLRPWPPGSRRSSRPR